ncbi:MAG TPA: hypothetical protein VF896_17415 [Anaerolineales bacterium]
MNKLNVNFPSLLHPVIAESDALIQWFELEEARRLIILIPADVDCASVTRRLWELANATGSTVQLLGLCKDTSQEPALRRELITVSALIQDAKVSVEIKVEIGTDWVDAVKHNYQKGDMIVCIAEQAIGIRRQPLSQILESRMQVPVYILSKLQPPKPQTYGLARATAWSGFLGIMVGFFLLQVKIIQVSKDGFQTLMLLLLLIPEFWFIKIWNSLFS